MSMRIVYIPQTFFEWNELEGKPDGSDGCLYWYFDKEAAKEAFPKCIIEEIEVYFPEPWEQN